MNIRSETTSDKQEAADNKSKQRHSVMFARHVGARVHALLRQKNTLNLAPQSTWRSANG